jgi:branched-chain amino acid transport system permease protein
LSGFLLPDFWIGVGITAGIYALFTLGLQLSCGLTGLINFGQAGFMAIGAYTMGILVVDHHWSFWASLPAAALVTSASSLLVGLPSLRLRADYLAIVTIAFAEIVRYTAQNAGFTGGNQGILGFDGAWWDLIDSLAPMLKSIGLASRPELVLLVAVWATFLVLALLLAFAGRTPWGRVLRAIREDEDAAAALGKNVLSYKLQSLAGAAVLAGIAGWFLAVQVTFLYPSMFEPNFTFLGYAILILGGLGSFVGVGLGSLLFWFLLEGLRLLDLPLGAEQLASLRFILVGLLLIGLTMLRPQGMLGNRQEMLLQK